MKRIIMVIMALLLLASCAAEPTSGTATSEGIAFDNYGRDVVIDKIPEKVLTLGPNCTELFAALGLSDKVIGSSPCLT
jgi:iron complex transport system substrate-binding protein